MNLFFSVSLIIKTRFYQKKEHNYLIYLFYKNSGNVSENVRTNLEKMEELFLHTITQQKQIKALEESNRDDQNKLQKQELLLQQLTTRLEVLENQ